ncbi:MAG: threonine synthase [Gammaproteobacteria bacterium]|nr:threonine synthase [Gammaproteobacteria bacterium]MBK7728612.1 threonine synthase [Gammaproteobacteria bacterium]MBK9664334.1 threonine synthase [Gammaproteobacteria bacterium]MBP6051295.1 threonine synthase [Pseudomonadales bacterium]MBP6226459.1 threonine synthase [Pseudomonadales bacterium]
MRYISTRGQAPALAFEDVLLTGLAPDGGLYVPETLPRFEAAQLLRWRSLGYAELAAEIMQPFVEGFLEPAELRAITAETYADFRHPAVAPLVQLGHNEWLLELFHGPTLAFKDFALQLLGRLLERSLARRNERVVVLGATSGDTGSAAIEGCRRSQHVDIFILHPHQRVSEVQRRQMTTVAGDNIHNLAIQGNFDDCQEMVKSSFSDQSFLPSGRRLVAVNSINWARIMAQIVYYFYAALALGAPSRKVSFAVPTGNFGDIYAGYLARRMGLPVEQLVVATNVNDILHRFLASNCYHREPLAHTLSPSMDIVISSNFERALFDFHDRDGAAIASLMQRFRNEDVSVAPEVIARARAEFGSCSVDDEQTCATIATVFRESEYLLDPHSAIAVRAARATRTDAAVPMIALATAHPAKFPEAVLRAGVTRAPGLPLHMQDLFERPERCTVLAHDLAAVQSFIRANL